MTTSPPTYPQLLKAFKYAIKAQPNNKNLNPEEKCHIDDTILKLKKTENWNDDLLTSKSFLV